MLIAADTHPKLLQLRLDHTSIKTTLDIYGRLCEPLDEIAVDDPLITETLQVGVVTAHYAPHRQFVSKSKAPKPFLICRFQHSVSPVTIVTRGQQTSIAR